MSTAVAKRKEPTDITPVSETPNLSSVIERVMTDPAFPVDRVNQAFDFYQRVHADQADKEWSAAFVACQAEMEPVRKNASNPQTRSKYVTFEQLDGAIRPVYSKHGFATSYDTEDSPKPEHVRVVMYLIHKGGHQRRYHVDIPADGKGAKGNDVMTKTHATGSAFTYGKRYVLGNAFSVATTDKDDDGNAAGGNSQPITEKQVNELIALADAVGADKQKFCEFYQINSFADIQANQFDAAKARLELKRKARK